MTSDRAAALLKAINAASGVSVARALRRRLSRDLRSAPATDVCDLGLEIIAAGHKWIGYEILSDRADVLRTMTSQDVEALGHDLADWGAIDAYGILLVGPAWQAGVVSDDDIVAWTQSANLWRRRAALVATVLWNKRSRGGSGDSGRTLPVCERLVDDPEDMVVKALSWALRALAAFDPNSVDAFLVKHQTMLAARVKREVRNKLQTGRKAG